MKKFLLNSLFCLFFSGYVFAADHFVDPYTGNNADDGHSTDAAWATLEYAVESGSLTAGDKVWFRRDNNGSPTVEMDPTRSTDIAPAYDGTASSFIEIIGAPRAEVAITAGDFTNGSTTVDNITGITLTHENALTRMITAPNGNKFMITDVTDGNTLIIDREYSGSTVTGASGACTIDEDDDYDAFAAIDDSAWTIKIAAWIADAHDIPTIDFNDGAFQWHQAGDTYHAIKNIKFMDSSDGNGILYVNTENSITVVKNCYIKQSASNNPVMRLNSYRSIPHIENCVLEGSGSGGSQVGIIASGGKIKNSAIYGCGDYGVALLYPVLIEGTNIGVEAANIDDDLEISYVLSARLRDVRLGGTNGYCQFTQISGNNNKITVENYGKVLGKNKTWHNTAWTQENVTFDGSGSLPSQRSGGAATGIMITPASASPPRITEGYEIFEHVYSATDASKTYKYYVQSIGALANTEIRLEATYVDSYDDTSEYTQTAIYSTEAVTARSDQADWDQYLSVTVDPAVASLVRIKLVAAYYHATNLIYIDPKAVIE